MGLVTQIPVILIISISLLIVGYGESVYAGPRVFEDGSLETAILKTVQYTVDMSKFKEYEEIIINVTFENTGNNYDGIKFLILPAPVNGTNDPDEFYAENENDRRFYIQIDDITNSVRVTLDPDDIKITSGEDFVKILGEIKNYKDIAAIEILDIDDLVNSSQGPQKIETELTLTSSKFFPGNEFELHIWTDTDTSPSDKPVIITISKDFALTRSEVKAAEEKSRIPEECPIERVPMCGVNGITYNNRCILDRDNIKLDHTGKCIIHTVDDINQQELFNDAILKQMKEQSLKAQQEADLRKQQILLEEKNTSDIPKSCSSIIDYVCGVDGTTYSNQCWMDVSRVHLDHEGECSVVMNTETVNLELSIEPEPTYIPEPKSEPICGLGTETVNGMCVIIKQPKNEYNFFDSFVKMFSNLFG